MRAELPKDRLASTDETGRRVWIYPADVRGLFRKRRTLTQFVLMVFFLILPWLKIGENPVLLLDLPRRRFSIFGVLFWAHDAPLLFFFFAGAALGLALLTALWGRVWCGWACPQTVFIDGVFRRIERWIEGDAVVRKRRDLGPWTLEKLYLKFFKYGVFLLISMGITHSFLAYFVGTDRLAEMVRSSPSQNPEVFLWMVALTALVAFDFGWFREQFCVIVCPYGRLQSLFVDARSLVVAYVSGRGEPRGKTGVLASGAARGDCVDCGRCVNVCPTGVDIRRGLQLECIQCTACIDACDEVMHRLGKPPGLIRYQPIEENAKGMRFRPVLYSVLLCLIGGGLFYQVRTRRPLEVTFTRAIETPYQVTGEGKVINHFKLGLKNQTFKDQRVRVEWADKERALKIGAQWMQSNFKGDLASGEATRSDVFVVWPKSEFKMGVAQVEARVIEEYTEKEEKIMLRLVGPF